MLINGVSGNTVSIRDRGLLYGDGVFRTLRVAQGKASHWPLHYLKLQRDCTVLGIICPEEALLRAELSQVLAQHPDGVVKLIVTRGESGRGYTPSADATPTRIWDFSPMPDYPPECATQGIKVRVCSLRLSIQPRLACVKHLNRLENVLAAAELNEAQSHVNHGKDPVIRVDVQRYQHEVKHREDRRLDATRPPLDISVHVAVRCAGEFVKKE